MRVYLRFLLLCMLWVINCELVGVENGLPSEELTTNEIHSFFATLDRDGDGSIEAREAMVYIESVGGEELDTDQERAEAFESMMSSLDSATRSPGRITEEEMKEHLARLSRSHRVAEWVSYGVGLPQYADAFRQNAVTVMDFPLLVNDEGALLEQEFGISSLLHRQKFLRAMKRQLLALGRLPDPATDVRCSLVPGGIAVTWQPPQVAGQPPVGAEAGPAPQQRHLWPVNRFVLERRELGGAVVGQWVPVAEVTDDVASAVDLDPWGRGLVSYRITAWSEFGPSLAAEVDNCGPAADLPPIIPHAAVLADPASSSLPLAGAFAGSSLLAAGHGQGLDSHRTRSGVVAGATWLLRALYTVAMVAASLAMRSQWALRWVHFVGTLVLRRMRPAPAPASPNPVSIASPAGAGRDGTKAAPKQGARPPESPRQSPGAAVTGQLQPAGGRQWVDSGASQGQNPGTKPKPATQAAPAPAEPPGAGAAPSGPRDPSSPPAGNVSAMATLEDVDYTWPGLDGVALGDGGLQGGEPGVEGAWPPEVPLQSSPKLERVDDGRCAHPGCTARLDRFKLDLKRKHFCGICDRTYCSEHTCWVSHGPMSRCDLESKCICFGCYPLLSDNHPARKRGPGRRMPKSPSVPNDMSYGPDAHLAGEALPAVGERTPSMTPTVEKSGRSIVPNPAGLATAPAGRGTKNGAPPEPADETRGRRNWRKGRIKILAAIKFKLGPKKAQRDEQAEKDGQ